MGSVIDKLDKFADSYIGYLKEHDKWFYCIGSVIIYLSIVIPVTVSSGFNFLFVVSMLLAACILGWPMMLVFMLPSIIIRLVCYCINKPAKAFFIFLKLIIGFAALFLLALLISSIFRIY